MQPDFSLGNVIVLNMYELLPFLYKLNGHFAIIDIWLKSIVSFMNMLHARSNFVYNNIGRPYMVILGDYNNQLVSWGQSNCKMKNRN